MRITLSLFLCLLTSTFSRADTNAVKVSLDWWTEITNALFFGVGFYDQAPQLHDCVDGSNHFIMDFLNLPQNIGRLSGYDSISTAILLLMRD